MTGFKLISRRKDELPIRDRRDSRSDHLVFRAEDGFEVALPARVVEELHDLGRRAAPREFLGLVYGTLAEDSVGTHAVVSGIMPVEGADATEVTVASTPSAAAAAEEAAERLFPRSRRLGWAHSHPRYGPCFSNVDRANQATYLSPTALGIVVDPWCKADRGLAVYRGPKSERMSLVRMTPERDVGAATFRILTSKTTAAPEKPGSSHRETRRVLTGLVASTVLFVAAATMLGVRLAAYERRLFALEHSRVTDTSGSAVPALTRGIASSSPMEAPVCSDPAALASSVVSSESGAVKTTPSEGTPSPQRFAP